jgi:hypothetical protein
VKKPSTTSKYERWAKASPIARRSDSGAACLATSLRGVASANENGSTASTLTAKIRSACCQPNWSISRTASGENRN